MIRANQKIGITIKEVIPRIKISKPRIILGLIMSTTMATILSFVLTFSSVGFSPNFLSIWISRLELSVIVGPPIALLLLPIVLKIVGKIVGPSHAS